MDALTQTNNPEANVIGYCALGFPAIDATHQEFLDLCYMASHVSSAGFPQAFQKLFEHTVAHFTYEEEQMAAIGHSALGEHKSDHLRILGDMNRLQQRVQNGRLKMARAWVGDNLLQWFDTHVKTMDSALVADLLKS